MINPDSLKIYPFSYPILKTDTLIEAKAYNELKNNWPDFSQFETFSYGQVSRNNLELKKPTELETNVARNIKLGIDI